MYMRRKPGQTGLFGRKEFLLLPAHLKFQKNWIGIFGRELQKKFLITPHIFHSIGVVGGLMVPEHWVIWLVILWILFIAFSRSFIRIPLKQVLQRSGQRCGMTHKMPML